MRGTRLNITALAVILAGAAHLGGPGTAAAMDAQQGCKITIRSPDGTVREISVEGSSCTINILNGTCTCTG